MSRSRCSRTANRGKRIQQGGISPSLHPICNGDDAVPQCGAWCTIRPLKLRGIRRRNQMCRETANQNPIGYSNGSIPRRPWRNVSFVSHASDRNCAIRVCRNQGISISIRNLAHEWLIDKADRGCGPLSDNCNIEGYFRQLLGAWSKRLSCREPYH